MEVQQYIQLSDFKLRQLDCFQVWGFLIIFFLAVNKLEYTSSSILQKPFFETADMNVMRQRGKHWLFGMQWFSGWTLACGTHYPTVKFVEAGGEKGDREGWVLENLSRISSPIVDSSVKSGLSGFETQREAAMTK